MKYNKVFSGTIFSNFSMEFWKKHCGWNAVKVAIACDFGVIWMNAKKKKFRKLACGATNIKRRNRCGKRRDDKWREMSKISH